MRILKVSVVLLALCVVAIHCIETDDRQNSDTRACPESCLLRKNEGISCGVEMERVRWHFNPANGICESLKYKGCNGNKNRFLSKKTCFKKCLGCRYLLDKPRPELGWATCTCKDIDDRCRVSIKPPSGYICQCSHDQNWKCVGKAIHSPINDSIEGAHGGYITKQRIPGLFSELTEMIGQRSNDNLMAYQTLLARRRSKSVALEILSQDRPDICTRSLLPCAPSYPYRMTNGTCNNIQNPLWGSTFTPFRRVLPQGYADGMGEPRGGLVNSTLPNAKLVSTMIHSHLILPDSNTTNMVGQIGQFLDHDMSMAPEGDKPCCTSISEPTCWPIKVFSNDTFYSQQSPPQNCLAFTRSTPYCFPTPSGIREQMNLQTGFIDGSQIYGPDSERVFQLRQYAKGRLRENTDNPNLLPTVKQVVQVTAQHIEFMGDFLAGDSRVNVMPGLATMHTLMYREHNRIANEIYKRRPYWSDEIIFQESRRLVVAQWQNVIYSEFLPIILGPVSMEKYKISLPTNPAEYSTYDPNVNPTIIHAFSSAANRFGYSLINGIIQLVKGVTNVGSYLIRDNYFVSAQITQQTTNGFGYDLILGGLIVQNAQTSDPHVTDWLINYLQRDVSSNNFASDLIARNIQRGRDHGIRGYWEYRTFCGLSPLTDSWSDMPKEIRPKVWTKLSSLYKTPKDIDLFTGGLSECLVPDGLSGPTFNCIKSMQFSNLKDGDRFFFTHLNQPRPFTPPQLTMLRSRTLGDIICDNSGVQATAQNVFRPFNNDSNMMLKCSDPRRTGHLNANLIPPSGVKLVHTATNLCLTIHGGSPLGGTFVILDLHDCMSPLSDDQRYDIAWKNRDNPLLGVVIARHAKKCMEVTGSGRNKVVVQRTCSESHSQEEWGIVLEAVGDIQDPVVSSFRLRLGTVGSQQQCVQAVDDKEGNAGGVQLADCQVGRETDQLFRSFASI